MPAAPAEDMFALLHADLEEEAPPPPRAPAPPPESVESLFDQIAAPSDEEEAYAVRDLATPPPPKPDYTAAVSEIIEELSQDAEAPFRAIAVSYQDFTVRCRMQRIPATILGLPAFRRRFAMALAGFGPSRDPAEADAELLEIGRAVPDDLLAPFLLIARAAIDSEPCPDDDALARIYGTRSPGRIRRLLEHLEKSGFIVLRADYGGRRSIGIPGLNVSTTPQEV